MSKIYLVISSCGEYEERVETVEKAFKNIKRAELYKKELEEQENICRQMAKKCMECGGLNKDCPYYETPFFDYGDECENYNPWHDETDYRIDEVELIE